MELAGWRFAIEGFHLNADADLSDLLFFARRPIILPDFGFLMLLALYDHASLDLLLERHTNLFNFMIFGLFLFAMLDLQLLGGLAIGSFLLLYLLVFSFGFDR